MYGSQGAGVARAAPATRLAKKAVTVPMSLSEQEWLSHREYPDSMLYDLPVPVSLRKRLLLCATFCRRVWHLLTDERAQRAVEVAEQHADRKATDGELATACAAAEEITTFDGDTVIWCEIGGAAFVTAEPVPSPECVAYLVAEYLGWEATNANYQGVDEPDPATLAAERAAQCDLVREILGNPFRPSMILPAWRAASLVSLAQATYDERRLPSGHLDPTRLAILADALEETGCTDQAILDHLREPGVHVRGCWVVDHLLKKV